MKINQKIIITITAIMGYIYSINANKNLSISPSELIIANLIVGLLFGGVAYLYFKIKNKK